MNNKLAILLVVMIVVAGLAPSIFMSSCKLSREDCQGLEVGDFVVHKMDSEIKGVVVEVLMLTSECTVHVDTGKKTKYYYSGALKKSAKW